MSSFIERSDMIEALSFQDVWRRVIASPFKFIARAWEKLIGGWFKYGTGEGYKSAEYWNDRYAKYQDSILAPGDEGLSEAENRREYEEAIAQFIQVVEESGIPKLVFELGYRTGEYAEALFKLGVKSYIGTDIAAPTPKPSRMKEFHFEKTDITSDKSSILPRPSSYDLTMAIDVLQHIVDKTKFQTALRVLWRALKPQGRLILALPLTKRRSRRHSFYVRIWTLEDITKVLGIPYCFERNIPFRGERLLVFRKVA